MKFENPLQRKRRRTGAKSTVPIELPMDMLQLLGKSTEDEMLNSFLKNTSVTPLGVLSRLKQFGELYQDNMWSISAREAFDVLEAFRKAYGLIVEEDKRTGNNTCKGFCKTFDIRCVAVGHDEFDSALQEAESAICRHETAEEVGKRFEAAEAAR